VQQAVGVVPEGDLAAGRSGAPVDEREATAYAQLGGSVNDVSTGSVTE
jgi:hypothetical protein